MKTTTNRIPRDRACFAKVFGRSMALALVALALQGCRTPHTAWMRDVGPQQESPSALDETVPPPESRPLISLLTLSF